MANVNYAHRRHAQCVEFIHRTQRPFRLIAAKIETFAAGLAIGIEIVKPLKGLSLIGLYTHSTTATVTSSATSLSTECDVDEALQSADLVGRLVRILLGLQTGFDFHVILRFYDPDDLGSRFCLWTRNIVPKIFQEHTFRGT